MSTYSGNSGNGTMDGGAAVTDVTVEQGGGTTENSGSVVSEMEDSSGTSVADASSAAMSSKRKVVDVYHGECEPAFELPRNLAELVKIHVMDKVIPIAKFLDDDSARQLVGRALDSLALKGSEQQIQQQMARYWMATQKLMIDQTMVERKAMRAKYTRNCKQGTWGVVGGMPLLAASNAFNGG